jgi:hypothetical protein
MSGGSWTCPRTVAPFRCASRRRFRCPEPGCRRHIFAERLGDTVAGRSARRTSRLEAIVLSSRHRLGRSVARPRLRLRPGSDKLPVSKDTLLRVVRRHAADDTSPLCIIRIDDICGGRRPVAPSAPWPRPARRYLRAASARHGSERRVDDGAAERHADGRIDWAWKRGQRYGRIICDLQRRRIVDLLPDREPATVEAWLSHHPGVRIRAAPQAVQVADRWHLMENASAAFLEAARRSRSTCFTTWPTKDVGPFL